MEFIKNFSFTPLNTVKLAGIIIGGLVILSVGLTLVTSVFGALGTRTPAVSLPGFAVRDQDMGEYVTPSAAYYGTGSDMAQLSVRNVAGLPIEPPYPQPGTTGDSAEEYEVTNYSASIESTDAKRTCGSVAGLKSRSYVIFEHSNEYDQGCSYTFKVTKANVPEILTFLNGLNPKDLSENTYTIKNQVDDFTSETEILQKKLTSIDETLENALAAYDSITSVATQNHDAASLATIINSRIQLIERLTQEKINVTEQLDRITRAKSEQLDRLDYTYFTVSVFENKYLDMRALGESWKAAVRQFFYDVNKIAQDLTVNLVVLLFVILQYVLYFFILLFVAKYAWRAALTLWKR